MSDATPPRLGIALPGKGRLMEPAMDLLKRSGYRFRRRDRHLQASCTTADITFIFVRADDVPVLVSRGVVDLGITGSDLVAERNLPVDTLMPLGFGRCRLCVAGPESLADTPIDWYEGKNIATSFPRTTARWFADQGVSVQPIEMQGSMEIMVSLELAHAIVDVVETGDTLREHHLVPLLEVGRFEAVLIGAPGTGERPDVRQVVRRLEGILVADRYSILEYNIPEALLAQAEEITPGFESPTVSKLDQPGWLAVKVLVETGGVPAVMDRLEQLGATGIFESAVRNCRL